MKQTSEIEYRIYELTHGLLIRPQRNYIGDKYDDSKTLNDATKLIPKHDVSEYVVLPIVKTIMDWSK